MQNVRKENRRKVKSRAEKVEPIDYADDPVGFVEDLLGERLWDRQKEIMLAVRDNKRVSIRAAHACGKSFVLARLVLWYLFTRPNSLVITTAPTAEHLISVLWGEIQTAFAKRRFETKAEMLKGSLTISPRWRASSVVYADGSAFNEAVAGRHAEHVMVIVDEASALPQSVYASLEGSLAGENARLVLAGNPLRADGGIFHTSHSSGMFKSVKITGHDAVAGCEGKQIAGIVTKSWIDEMAIAWGADSNHYRVRVMADFPNEDDDVLISASLVEAAEAREQSPAKGDGKMVIGLDIARAGSDNTAWVLRKGNYARVLMVKNGLDLMQTVGLTMKFLQDFPSAVVHLDLVSLGSGVFDRLRETEYARRVFGVGFGEKAQDEKTYKNLRVEAYDQTRQWLKHACLEKSPYWKELCIPHKTFDSSGRLVLETKEQIKRRGFSSPDVADALCFTLTRKLSSGGLTRPTFIDERALDLFGV